MEDILNLMADETDIIYFIKQKENFKKNFQYQKFDEALENLEEQKFDIENQLLKINQAIDLMTKYFIED